MSCIAFFFLSRSKQWHSYSFFCIHWFSFVLFFRCCSLRILYYHRSWLTSWLPVSNLFHLFRHYPKLNFEGWCCFDPSLSFSLPFSVCIVDPFRYLLLKCIRCAINLMLMSNCNFKPLSDINYLTFFARMKSMSVSLHLARSLCLHICIISFVLVFITLIHSLFRLLCAIHTMHPYVQIYI